MLHRPHAMDSSDSHPVQHLTVWGTLTWLPMVYPKIWVHHIKTQTYRCTLLYTENLAYLKYPQIRYTAYFTNCQLQLHCHYAGKIKYYKLMADVAFLVTKLIFDSVIHLIVFGEIAFYVFFILPAQINYMDSMSNNVEFVISNSCWTHLKNNSGFALENHRMP